MGQTELFDISTESKQMTYAEIELLDQLIVCKQMTDVQLNNLWYVAILGTI